MVDFEALPADHPLRDPVFRAGWEARMAKARPAPEAPVDEPEIKRDASSGPAGSADPVAKARHAEAVKFITEYRGTFGFILDLRARRDLGSKWYHLSEKQVDAVLRIKARDEAPRPERKQTGRDLVAALPMGRTCAAVTNDEGHTTFLLIDIPEENDRYGNPSRWAGWAFVKQFIGGVGEGKRLGSQRPGETYVGQWSNLVDKVLEDPEAAVRRFGQELGICGVCQLPLTNEESREYGIGPVCRKKMGGGA